MKKRKRSSTVLRTIEDRQNRGDAYCAKQAGSLSFLLLKSCTQLCLLFETTGLNCILSLRNRARRDLNPRQRASETRALFL